MVADNPAKKITAGRVNEALNDHIQEHRDKINPMIERHEIALFGPDGCGGLANSYTVTKTELEAIKAELNKLGGTINKVGVSIIIALAGAVITFLVSR